MRRLPARRPADNIPLMVSESAAAVRGQRSVDAAFEDAWRDLCGQYPEGSWFRDSHLAEGKGRFHRIVRDLFELIPPGTERPVLDVGCYNGFFCYLLHKLGYRTSGFDGIPDEVLPDRPLLLGKIGAEFFPGNLDERDPFQGCPPGRFSAVVLAGVLEIVFNHPFALLSGSRDLLAPGGILVVSAINPHTLANSLRVLRGRSTMEGDAEFARTPKIGADGTVVGYQPKQLVYREYPLPLLVELVEEAGFTVVRKEYFGSRPHPDQAPLVRLVKSTPAWAWMQKQRLFGSGIHLVARRNG